MARFCSRSTAARPRGRGGATRAGLPSRAAFEPAVTKGASASRIFAAFFFDRSISYCEPSIANLTVSSASPPSMSSTNMWIVRFAIRTVPSNCRLPSSNDNGRSIDLQRHDTTTEAYRRRLIDPTATHPEGTLHRGYGLSPYRTATTPHLQREMRGRYYSCRGKHARLTAEAGVRGRREWLDGADLLRLRALLALGDLELDPLILLEAAVATGLDGGEVHEHVVTTSVLADETEPLVGVEPLHRTLCHCHLLVRRKDLHVQTHRPSWSARPRISTH